VDPKLDHRQPQPLNGSPGDLAAVLPPARRRQLCLPGTARWSAGQGSRGIQGGSRLLSAALPGRESQQGELDRSGQRDGGSAHHQARSAARGDEAGRSFTAGWR